jgi:hypothetical protein
MTETWNLYREKKPYILALVINIIMFLMEPDGKSLQLCKTKIYYYIRRWSVEQIMPYF